MASKKNSTSKMRRLSCISSCFGWSPLLDSGNTKAPGSSVVKASRISWLRFRAKKRTVPVDHVLADATPGVAPKEKPVKKTFFQKFRKDKSSKHRSPLHHHQPQHPAAKSHVAAEPHSLQVRHVASKCDVRSKPAPLYRMRDAVRTGTRTSHTGSPEPGHCTTSAAILCNSNHRKPRNKCNETIGCLHSCVGLSVLAVALALTLLLGRACAIVCMTSCLYLLPRFTSATNMARNAVSRKSDDEIDMSSEEHKKRVVLMGLLQREGRRPSVAIQASTR